MCLLLQSTELERHVNCCLLAAQFFFWEPRKASYVCRSKRHTHTLTHRNQIQKGRTSSRDFPSQSLAQVDPPACHARICPTSNWGKGSIAHLLIDPVLLERATRLPDRFLGLDRRTGADFHFPGPHITIRFGPRLLPLSYLNP